MWIPMDFNGSLTFLNYRESTVNSKATQEEVDKFAREVNKSWWDKNKDRFLK